MIGGIYLKFTESMLNAYSQPLSATEEEQCRNAIRMVADALKTFGFTDDNAAIAPLYPDTFSYSLQCIVHRIRVELNYLCKDPMRIIQMYVLKVMWMLQ